MGEFNSSYPFLVSIVTVVKNLISSGRREQIIQCIESVHNQTYRNYEHIVIDGDSTDGTLDLLREYVNLKWIRLYSERDDGIYSAMNKGISYCKGKYILFLNSDDFFASNKSVEKSVASLVQHDADISFGSYKCLGKNGSLSFLQRPEIGLFYLRMPFCHQTCFARVSAIKELDGFDESYKSASDFDLILRLILKGSKCVRVDEDLIRFREGGFSVSSGLSEKEFVRSLTTELSKLLPVSFEKMSDNVRNLSIDKEMLSLIKERVDFSVRKEMDRLDEEFTLEGSTYRWTGFSISLHNLPDGIEKVLSEDQLSEKEVMQIFLYLLWILRKRVKHGILSSFVFGEVKKKYSKKILFEDRVLKYFNVSRGNGLPGMVFCKYYCKYFEINTIIGFPIFWRKFCGF